MKKFLIIVGLFITTVMYSQNFSENYNNGVYYNDDMSINIGSINFTVDEIPILIEIFERADKIYQDGKNNKIDIHRFFYRYNDYNFTFKLYYSYLFSSIIITNALEKSDFCEKIYKTEGESFVKILTIDRDNYYKKYSSKFKIDSASNEKTSLINEKQTDSLKKESVCFFNPYFFVMLIILFIFVSLIPKENEENKKL